MNMDIKSLRKEEIIILYRNLRIENRELRSRLNQTISEVIRKKYKKEYGKEYRKKHKKKKDGRNKKGD